MKILGIFYLISFILIFCFADMEWGEAPANVIQRIIASIISSFIFTLTLGIWLYGIVAFFKNIIF